MEDLSHGQWYGSVRGQPKPTAVARPLFRAD